MASTAENYMIVKHPRREELVRALNAWNSGSFLSIMVPQPQYDDPLDGILWRTENWTTKWEIGRKANVPLTEIVNEFIRGLV